ncbi:hypothetical protein NY551_03445 [Curtobacterium flaccumfaciens pv. oortii]|uniref:hypothetical protein n=1 Tax=Curtobacterium flaccumfaciens TaxID=2035 RepID=UPI0026592DD4|nr:hypothetical protein [Curtobacterium flaccumfaciens]MCS5521787.1 hypothetical protein [Curtobacterium flaccumfaciens pv. oortii]
MPKVSNGRTTLLRDLLNRLRAVRQRRRARQERSMLPHAIFWPVRVVVDAFWTVVDAVLTIVLLLVIIVMAPIWLVQSFLG